MAIKDPSVTPESGYEKILFAHVSKIEIIISRHAFRIESTLKNF